MAGLSESHRVGDYCVVTGDRADMGHHFPSGSEVRVLQVDHKDDTCLVTDEGSRAPLGANWVGWVDLEPTISEAELEVAVEAAIESIHKAGGGRA